MAEMQFGLMLRAQFPRGDDMAARFRELLEQARLANQLGYASITKGMHYSSAPWQDFQHLDHERAVARHAAEPGPRGAPHARRGGVPEGAPGLTRLLGTDPGLRASGCAASC